MLVFEVLSHHCFTMQESVTRSIYFEFCSTLKCFQAAHLHGVEWIEKGNVSRHGGHQTGLYHESQITFFPREKWKPIMVLTNNCIIKDHSSHVRCFCCEGNNEDEMKHV